MDFSPGSLVLLFQGILLLGALVCAKLRGVVQREYYKAESQILHT